MGRPLNKKYFGNRNIGSTGSTTDGGLGGEGVASAAVSGGAYTTRPTFTFTAPELPGGVTATATVTSKAKTGAVTTAGTGYVQGDLLTLTSNGGSAIAYVASVGGSGEILTVNFSGTGASVGSFEALPGAKFPSTPTGGRSCTSNSALGTGAEITVTFEALSTVITEKGSGYTAAPSAATGPTQSVTLGAVVLTTDSGGYDGNGALNVTGNQENAISITAWVPTANGGSSAVVGDIVKQQGSRRYKVKTAQGTGVVKLVADTIAAGQATIIATDANGNTYYVTKLTNHKALLTRLTDDGSDGDWVYATGDSARWTFSAAAGTDKTAVNTTVQIANA